jgi:YHS domain-containing protein
MKRLLLLLVMVVFLLAPGTAIFAHDVIDPVCRMTVDSDTTPFQHRAGGKTYYFCTEDCLKSFRATPDKYIRLAETLANSGGQEYAVTIQPSKSPIAGKPTELVIGVRYAKTGKIVSDFELTHEKLLHLVMTTEDLAWFEHQHPVRDKDGLFRLTWTFPRAGKYRLYTDFTPADGDNQVKQTTLTVQGNPTKSVPLKPDTQWTRQVGEYEVSLEIQPGVPLVAEKAAVLTYTIRDKAGNLLTDMQPFIGSMGHLMAIHSKGELLHTHVLHGNPQQQTVQEGNITITPEMTTTTGPRFSFKVTLPESGTYRLWAQFMRQNRVLTVPFTVNVTDLWASTPSVQKLTVQIANGVYSPNALSLVAGKPVELTFVGGKGVGCGDVIVLPDLNIKKTLDRSGKAVVRFTPTKAGTLKLTCGMGHYSGKIVVR